MTLPVVLAAREDALNESTDLQDKFGGAIEFAKPKAPTPRQNIDDDTAEAV